MDSNDLDYPDLMNDDSFKSQIGVKFNKYNIFEEMKEMELLRMKCIFSQMFIYNVMSVKELDITEKH